MIIIAPTSHQIRNWIENYVPELDFFFVKKEQLSLFDGDLERALTVPKNEFFSHSIYGHIQMVNSFEYWNLSAEVEVAIVAHADWITRLESSRRQKLLAIQFDMGRGLIFPVSYFAGVEDHIEQMTTTKNGQAYVVVCSGFWKTLPLNAKEKVVSSCSQQWDDWTGIALPNGVPDIVKKYANRFPVHAGSNCFASVLAAINQEEWLIHEWVHPNTFMDVLGRTHRFVEKQSLEEGDVVVWTNERGAVQHASYCLGKGLFFNKNGQSFFNPWKIASKSQLIKEWQEYTPQVYENQLKNDNHSQMQQNE